MCIHFSSRLTATLLLGSIAAVLAACGGGDHPDEAAFRESPLALATQGSLTDSTLSAASGALAMTISWMAPTLNDDGSLLTDLKGFVVLLGSQRGVYSRAIPINDPKAVVYTVDSLAAGQYYVAVKAVNRDGVESLVSAEVARLVR
jgi:hypothetical protein